MINKTFLIIIFSFFTIGSIVAQNIWYENSSSTNDINFVSATRGTFTTNETNPETSGINSNPTASKFVRDGQDNPTFRFKLTNPITDLSSYTISLKAHTSLQTADFNTANRSIRLFLRNRSIGGASNLFFDLDFSEGETWESFSFDFSGITIPDDVILAGGYDQIMVGLANGDNAGLTSTYYIDAISGYSEQTIPKATFLSGSWGVRFNLSGGVRLDKTSEDDWIAGVQELLDNVSTAGHVMTNCTHPAHGYYYTLRDNPYVDIANEIHPAMVPTLENEQIVFDVIDVIRNSGKKVILYLNTGGPSSLQGDSVEELEILAAWQAYYYENFDGDEGLAWRTLVKGYIERFRGLADGYWLDNISNLPGELSDFVAMIRVTDPDVAIATNNLKTFVEDENGNDIFVDSDGIDDEDPIDYRVRNFEATDPYMDYTPGHPTPLGQGAPPNSWAYEEFLFPLIVENPWDSYDGSKLTLKHYFVPIRDRWSVASANLVFEVEQAYRFVRTFTDPGASITWSTTITKGFITDDEMEIMIEINDRMSQSPKPDNEPYVRPEGAYLVGEGPSSVSSVNNTDVTFYPNPVTNQLIITRSSSDIIHIQLVSVVGKRIIEKTWDNGSLTTQLDLSAFKAGIYFINVSDDNNHNITQKIVISE